MCFLPHFFPECSVSRTHQAGASTFVPWQELGVRECLGSESSELVGAGQLELRA